MRRGDLQLARFVWGGLRDREDARGKRSAMDWKKKWRDRCPGNGRLLCCAWCGRTSV